MKPGIYDHNLYADAARMHLLPCLEYGDPSKLYNFDLAGITNPDETLARYIDSFNWTVIISTARYTAKNPEMSHNQWRRRMFGAIMNDIAFVTVRSLLPEGYSLLSPEQTLKLYTNMYPHAQEKIPVLGPSSLEGKYVPDGLLVDTSTAHPVIVGYGEYTTIHDKKLRNKIGRVYTMLGFDRKAYPALFAEAHPFFVLLQQPKEETSRYPQRFQPFPHGSETLTHDEIALGFQVASMLGITPYFEAPLTGEALTECVKSVVDTV